MIPKIIKTLERTDECKLLAQKNLSAILKCDNFYLLKSPYTQWNLYIPTQKLSSLQSKVKPSSITPQTITAGKFVRTGSWSKMQNFNINNEINYIFDNEGIAKTTTKDKEINRILEEMKDQEYYSSEEIRSFNVDQKYKENVRKLSNKINDVVKKDLKKNFGLPVICNSESNVQKFWAPENQSYVYKIATTCVIDGVKNEIENVLEGNLQNDMISQSDLQFITSKMTDDKNFILSGVTLYQNGAELPMLKFDVRNEDVLLQDGVVGKMKELGRKFTPKSDDEIEEIDIDLFTQFLY
jgi:hypothetical protein